jgi:hypothetical protein
MVIGCLGVERRAERFFSYLAIFSNLAQGPQKYRGGSLKILLSPAKIGFS